ncbi:MAG TPA: hypothetical protein VJB57_18850, partial [Dehalococcoidia bacterium]|nr:hypothetical protein [Dehalococcoidia bacterium]
MTLVLGCLLILGLANLNDVAVTTLSRLDGDIEDGRPEDFLAFYVAGKFVLDGRTGDLYDPDAVEETQEALVDRPVGGAEQGLPYFNPPFLAA